MNPVFYAIYENGIPFRFFRSRQNCKRALQDYSEEKRKNLRTGEYNVPVEDY